MTSLARSFLKLTGGTRLSYLTAGSNKRPAVLLLHGLPNSANGFRDIMAPLAEVAYVIAPDLPGFGQSDVLQTTTFDNFAAAVSELIDHLQVRDRYIYVHDFGAPVGLRIAMDAPQLVRGLIIQNANAHRTGFGPTWQPTFDYWSNPTAETEAAATKHLSFEGTRGQYIDGLPEELARTLSPANWEEDWRVMMLPGRLPAQRALLADYANYVAKFEAISNYLRTHQPPAVMVWGRHEIYFDLAEVVSWMQDLPRMEAHILDGGHLVLETQAAPAGRLMRDFIERTSR
jgi:pimeloyl-ACP methyl ester carboxylesterase